MSTARRLDIVSSDDAAPPPPGDRRFHVTVLSNFARAYDRYERAYRKASIPESTYPNEFYVLAAEDLAIGVGKASRLLRKLGIANDFLIAIEARLPRDLCGSNLRNGLGTIWPSGVLPTCNVWRVDADGALMPLGIEEAMARSLALHEQAFHSYEAIAPRSVSFLPIARGCQAACPFCFSEASASVDQPAARVDWSRVRGWLELARDRGAERAVVTGGGEPTLLAFDDLTRLIRECRAAFENVVLISNGVKLASMGEASGAAHLVQLRAAGLSVLAISRHHADEQVNARLMNLETHTPAVLRALRGTREQLEGLRVRLVCVLQRGGVASVRDIDDYVRWAAVAGVEEVCFKELYVSTTGESVYHSRAANAWSTTHQVALSLVLEWAAQSGFVLEKRLPWGAPVFTGSVGGRPMRVAAYTEPSLFWERTHGIARSWNVMADGTCFASLEDRRSLVAPPAGPAGPRSGP